MPVRERPRKGRVRNQPVRSLVPGSRKFALDSALEGSGFELAVPPPRERPFRGGRLGVLETLQAVASFAE